MAVCAAAAPASWPLPVAEPAEVGVSAAGLDRLHATLDRAVDAGGYSGYIVLLARDGKVVDWRAHGVRRVSTGEALQKDDIVRLFSMSKLFTSTAVLMLMEEGKLKLDDPAEKFLPALKGAQVFVGGTAAAPVLEPAKSVPTIRQLLAHTAGYYYDFSATPALAAFYHKADLWSSANLDEFVAKAGRMPLAHQPGTAFVYGINTDLLGAIVEKASGMTFDAFIAQRICTPLGLQDTGFAVPESKRSRVAFIHEHDAQGKLVESAQGGYNDRLTVARPGLYSGGGGLFSTAADYARFAQMLLNGGQLDGVRLLSRKSVELMTRDHIASLAQPHPFGQRDHGFGLGVRVLTQPGESSSPGSVGCFGWDGMATTNVQIDPKERTVAIVLFQHLPFNEGEILSYYTNGYYSALAD